MGVPNIELADVSNATLVLAIVLYAIAMLAYACDFAFGKREPAEAAPARRPADLMETAALVGAGSGAKSGAGPQGLEFAGHAFPADPGDPSELADLSQEGTRRSGGAGVRLTEGATAGGAADAGGNGSGPSAGAGGRPGGPGFGGLPSPPPPSGSRRGRKAHGCAPRSC